MSECLPTRGLIERPGCATAAARETKTRECFDRACGSARVERSIPFSTSYSHALAPSAIELPQSISSHSNCPGPDNAAPLTQALSPDPSAPLPVHTLTFAAACGHYDFAQRHGPHSRLQLSELPLFSPLREMVFHLTCKVSERDKEIRNGTAETSLLWGRRCGRARWRVRKVLTAEAVTAKSDVMKVPIAVSV